MPPLDKAAAIDATRAERGGGCPFGEANPNPTKAAAGSRGATTPLAASAEESPGLRRR